MNGVVRSVKMALLAGTFLSVPAFLAAGVVTPLYAAEPDTGSLSLEDMPPAPSDSSDDNKVFSFDEPMPDTGPSIFDDGVVPELPEPQTDDAADSAADRLPPPADPMSVDEGMAMPPLPEDGMDTSVDAGIPDIPPLPEDAASTGEQAAQQAEDELGMPALPEPEDNSILPEDGSAIFDLFDSSEPEIPETVVEEKPKPAPVKPKAAPKRVSKPAQPVVRLPKEYRLPSKIYKKEYDTENNHLPVAQYEHEYDAQMFLATGNDRTETVRGLLNTGRSIEMRNAAGDTPLLYAVRSNAQNTVRMLLGRGANPNAANGRGVTALHYAMLADSPQMTAALLEMGADPNLPDMNGVTPLMLAASKADPAYTQALIRSEAMVNLPSFDGRSPLHIAAESNNARAAALLVRAGADVNATKLRGYTPLMSAAAAGSADVVTVLLNAGADLRATDHLGRNAADLALAHRHDALANRLMTASIQRERSMSQAAPMLRPLGQ